MNGRRVHVAVAEAYDVWVGAGEAFVAEALAALVGEARRGVVITDRNVAGAGHAARVEAIWRRLGAEVETLVVAAGEASKDLATYGGLLETLAERGYDRGTVIAAVGGGVVGDLAGFVAATFLRGVPFVQLPTSLLAMVDASTGGKTGLDLRAGKNLVGAFHQPRGVVIDVTALATLGEIDLREGAVELVKHALLTDAAWFAPLRTAAGLTLPDRSDGSAWSALIAAGVRVKAEVVAADPFERSIRAHLNLGHTLAHALEAATGHGLRHGAAVALGLAFAAELGAARGYYDWRSDARAVVALAQAKPPDLALSTLMPYLARDKKRRDGRLRFVLLREPGVPFVCDDVSLQEIEQAYARVRTLPMGEMR
jgi:3-dehydroquinate synthase